MPLSPEEFHAHAVAAADEDQRLPLSRMTVWDDLLPTYPAAVADADAATVADALVASWGGRRGPAAR